MADEDDKFKDALKHMSIEDINALKSVSLKKNLVPRNEMERILVKWLKKELGVTVEPNKDSAASITLIVGPDLTVESEPPDNSSRASIGEKKVFMNMQKDDTDTLFHESMHMYLGIKKGFDNDYLDKLPSDLGKKLFAEEYRNLTAKVTSIFELEQKFTDGEKAALQKALGKPEYYNAVNKVDTGPLDLPRGDSYLGNLVDETATLGQKPEEGHPMQNYHEFFASAMTGLAFDGDKFFSMLKNLKELSERADLPNIQKAYPIIIELLHEVQRTGSEVLKELKQYGSTPQIQNLEKNLAQLQNFIAVGQTKTSKEQNALKQ